MNRRTFLASALAAPLAAAGPGLRPKLQAWGSRQARRGRRSYEAQRMQGHQGHAEAHRVLTRAALAAVRLASLLARRACGALHAL